MVTSAPMPPGKSNSLFDFQVNGFGGVDFQRESCGAPELERAAAELRRHGTSGIFATLVTAESDRLCARFAAMERARATAPGWDRMAVGYHLEGPWLCPEPGYSGAHPRGPMHPPSEAEFKRYQDAAGGRIRLLTLAPEWPGSPEFIAAVTRQGVHVSLGHTNASEAQIDAAIRAGARFATHLGNGTPATMHRHDNIIQRLLARDELTACLIPDGIHLPPFALRNFYRAKPPGRVLFTTDCMTGAGAPSGRYTIGDLEIEIGEDRVARKPGGEGNFAGSTLTPDDGVRRLTEYLGLDPAEAVRLWTDAPRAAFGLPLS